MCPPDLVEHLYRGPGDCKSRFATVYLMRSNALVVFYEYLLILWHMKDYCTNSLFKFFVLVCLFVLSFRLCYRFRVKPWVQTVATYLMTCHQSAKLFLSLFWVTSTSISSVITLDCEQAFLSTVLPLWTPSIVSLTGSHDECSTSRLFT